MDTDINDIDEWRENQKYNIGDLFIDSFATYDVTCYIYCIQYEPNSRITYYWVRHFREQEKDKAFTEEELDMLLEHTKTYLKHYPVKK
jgi:hypothetical protein